MTRNKYIIIFLIIFLAAAGFLFFRFKKIGQQNSVNAVRAISPVTGNIALTVMTTGIIEPQNRLEIKPSISGRIEEILVQEGNHVRTGDILAWMSSTERTALVDAARSRGGETLKYWEEVYKKTPIISPINGEVIVRSVEPGQTITASDIVLVLSDRLIVSAQFDETDIGKVRAGQKAFITLDAYPDIRLDGVVNHIAYESKIINNVTIYDVDILMNKTPQILRSGMSVSVEVIENIVSGVITIPSDVIHYSGERQFVLVRDLQGNVIERDITVGLNNEKNAEIVSGLTTEDTVVAQGNSYLPGKSNSGINPFMPSRKKK